MSIIYCAKLLLSQMLRPSGLFLEIKHFARIFFNLLDPVLSVLVVDDTEAPGHLYFTLLPCFFTCRTSKSGCHLAR